MTTAVHGSAARMAVAAALPEEIAPLSRRVAIERRLRDRSFTALLGRLGDAPVAVIRTGDGSRAARRGLLAFVERVPVSGIVAIGVAGALSPALDVGDLVVAREILEAPTRLQPPAPEWIDVVVGTGRAVPGTVVNGGRMLSTPEEKRDAWVRSGRPEPAVIDLESAAFAAVAGERRLPYVVVRAVSDSASERLPVDFNRFVGRSGQLSRLRVALSAILVPARIGPFLRLRARTMRCARDLADVVVAVLRNPPR